MWAAGAFLISKAGRQPLDADWKSEGSEGVTRDDDEFPLLAVMRRYKVPMTREEYLKLKFEGNVPDEIGPEEEAELPEQFQLRYPSHEEMADFEDLISEDKPVN